MSIKLSDLTEVSELKDHIGEEVSLGGWCYNSRISKNVKFVVLRDGTGYVQCVFTNSALNNALIELMKFLRDKFVY